MHNPTQAQNRGRRSGLDCWDDNELQACNLVGEKNISAKWGAGRAGNSSSEVNVYADEGLD
jgi:hypothetical protein